MLYILKETKSKNKNKSQEDNFLEVVFIQYTDSWFVFVLILKGFFLSSEALEYLHKKFIGSDCSTPFQKELPETSQLIFRLQRLSWI